MINWAFNVCTGRIAHWNKANNSYISELVDRAKTFSPAIATLFVEFSGSSYTIVNYLVGPIRSQYRILKVDLRQITRDQFKSLHHINIWTLVAVFGFLNPKQAGSVLAACADFIGDDTRSKGLVKDVFAMPEFDVSVVSRRLWLSYAVVLSIPSPDPLGWFRLIPIFTVACTSAIDRFKTKLIQM